jgi:hypothetical protein
VWRIIMRMGATFVSNPFDFSPAIPKTVNEWCIRCTQERQPFTEMQKAAPWDQIIFTYVQFKSKDWKTLTSVPDQVSSATGGYEYVDPTFTWATGTAPVSREA